MNSLINVAARDLRKAATLKERIDALESELSRLLTGTGNGNRAPGRPGGRRKMSEAAKARLAAIARARWKKVKAAGRSRL